MPFRDRYQLFLLLMTPFALGLVCASAWARTEHVGGAVQNVSFDFPQKFHRPYNFRGQLRRIASKKWHPTRRHYRLTGNAEEILSRDINGRLSTATSGVNVELVADFNHHQPRLQVFSRVLFDFKTHDIGVGHQVDFRSTAKVGSRLLSRMIDRFGLVAHDRTLLQRQSPARRIDLEFVLTEEPQIHRADWVITLDPELLNSDSSASVDRMSPLAPARVFAHEAGHFALAMPHDAVKGKLMSPVGFFDCSAGTGTAVPLDRGSLWPLARIATQIFGIELEPGPIRDR